jgi:hypothetical protein
MPGWGIIDEAEHVRLNAADPGIVPQPRSGRLQSMGVPPWRAMKAFACEKWRQPKKAIMRRQGGGVRGLEDEVSPGIDERRLLLCIGAPQQEDDRIGAIIDEADDGVGEAFPKPFP